MRQDEGGGLRRLRRASIRQVAAAAGVSASTVSNVLNNPDLVATSTRRRVEDAMSEVGYVRNGAARQLRGAPSTIAGCLLLDTANPFFAEVSRGIEDRLTEAGYLLIVGSTDVRFAQENKYLRMMEELGVRGILVNPSGSRLDRLVQLSRRGTPVVLVDHPQAGAELCAVAVDDVHGGGLVADHLLALGHRRIAFLGSSADVRSVGDRGAGLRCSLAAAGPDIAATLVEVRVPEPCTVEAADSTVDRLLSLSPRPTAIVCFNDIVALGVLRGLRRRGVEVPDEMSVVGYDDVHFAEQLHPALTTVRQPKYQLGRTAAELLLAEGHPDHQHEEVRFTPELVVRASTSPPAAG
ncbi:LacI family DNA-binding transcriptional regulator [Saccharothrix saharensis]|uniref:LacI family DNA-binding transcriptional regulator n=1 Tax=Saccharothrix saharensis TaxID=571190 RepID=UPI0036B7E93B